MPCSIEKLGACVSSCLVTFHLICSYLSFFFPSHVYCLLACSLLETRTAHRTTGTPRQASFESQMAMLMLQLQPNHVSAFARELSSIPIDVPTLRASDAVQALHGTGQDLKACRATLRDIVGLTLDASSGHILVEVGVLCALHRCRRRDRCISGTFCATHLHVSYCFWPCCLAAIVCSV